MTGADIMVKCLEAEGVKDIFGYPGVAIAPFFNSLEASDINGILVRTEQSAAHAASGYSRGYNTEMPGVCAVTSGPGATNLITGIATAHADSIPLICITGQVNSALLGSDVFQEADITGACESFVKYSYLVKDPEDLARVFKEAFYVASTGRKGPVLIDVPIDVQQATVKLFKYPESINMRTYKPTVKGNPVQMKKVIKELERAKKPIICAGGGVLLSKGKYELLTFAEKNNIPIVTTMMGISVVSTEHPLCFGMVGNNGKAYANKAMNEADLIMMVGARVADRAISQPDLITKDKVMVHIDVDPAEIGKNAGPTIPLVGDERHIFEELIELDYEADYSEWLETLNEYKVKYARKRNPNPKYVDPAVFISTLSHRMEKDAIYIADVGQNQIWSCDNVCIKEGKFMTTGGMGTMGYSIPAAIGAKLRRKERQVVAVCGDGSFQMSMCELATAKQFNIPVKIVVLRNGYLGMVREYQHFNYNDTYAMVEMPMYPDLCKLSEAYDIPYVKVTNMADMDDALERFLGEDNSYILEAIIDPMDYVR